ncbi:MFS transporter [Streptomyces sp. NPDC058391]|uniref:MFS transporter n=1 Tax=Streptomyces sp. NPDC058391 TaxID=3346476 RepID=UPI00364FD5A0
MPSRWRRIAVLGFLTVLADGFDTNALTFVVPKMAKEWGLKSSAFTPALVATHVGVVIGYVLLGRLVNRFGRKPVIISGTTIFAVGSALTVLADSIAVLTVLRLFTALGLGVVLPASISLATDHAPHGRRESVGVMVVIGIAIGNMVAGGAGVKLIAAYGWTAIFWLGAALPTLLLPLLIWGLPRTAPVPSGVRAAAGQSGSGEKAATVGRLFQGGLAVPTALLWSFAFLVFMSGYALSTWIPTLLNTSFGFSEEQAPMGTVALGVGGVLGSLALIPLSTRVRTVLLVAGGALIGSAFVTVTALSGAVGTVLLVLLAIGSSGTVPGVLGQAAVAVGLYPASARTTGVAWAAAIGRVGSIVGPAVIGALLAADVSGRDVLLIAAVPMAAAAVVAVLLARRTASAAEPQD